jgi:hypothetical protein
MLWKLAVWIFVAGFSAGLVGAAAEQPATAAGAPADVVQRSGEVFGKRVRVSVLAASNTTKEEAVYKEDFKTGEGYTVTTAKNASVVLVFTNGSTLNLGPDTVLNIQEFVQEDWNTETKIAELTEEPSNSTTKLFLAKGELVGNVKKLHGERGSSFTVTTPVGAAGIRGTLFRIYYRPDPINPTRASFSVSTQEGNVSVQMQGAQGMVATSVPVTTSQEVTVTVDLTINATTGAVTVATPPQIVSTQPISTVNQVAIAEATQAVAQVVQNLVLPVPAPAPPSPPATPPATTPQPTQQEQPPTTTDTTPTTTPPPTTTPTPPVIPPAPTPVPAPPRTTPGAGGTS